MNEPENTRLLRLYKLLWEQIKDLDSNVLDYGICSIVVDMYSDATISHEEKYQLNTHMRNNKPNQDLYWFEDGEKGTADRKAFVQRMIKELENDK